MPLYVHMNSKESPKTLYSHIMSTGQALWVVMGNLYASISFTGNESYIPVLIDLNKNGQKKFVILSGRHGDQLGQMTDPKTHKFVARNPNSPGDVAINPEDDRKTAASLSARLGGITIPVVDVGKAPHNTVTMLKSTIESYLKKETVVILAWCYSLYAMKPGWYGPLAKVCPEIFAGANMVPIYWTARDWSWVLKCPISNASQLASKKALA